MTDHHGNISAQQLAELEAELDQAVDRANMAWEYAFSAQFLLRNLFLGLHQNQQLDGHALLSNLSAACKAMPESAYEQRSKRAVEELIEELRAALLAQPPHPGVH
ncbi:hypothetical protein [Pseudomonas sp.]|uniref:hypothetical protein n=1 Tax=Pseudomonas sp. TaxID=306 RepID=UPI003242980C